MARMRFEDGRSVGGSVRRARNAVPRLMWEARRIWERLGWAAALGIFFGILALMAYYQGRKQVQHQRVLAARLNDTLSFSSRPVNASGGHEITRQLEAFYAYLPEHEAIPDQLKTLMTLADKRGITLERAEYKPQPEPNAGFLRYRIVLPVKADYSRIQDFILATLRELPALTLESVSFKRDRIESSEVEAQIHYALLVRKPVLKSAIR